ncbi:Glycogen accumulation regulator GarA [Planctomyces sp. SH-PL14]|jgi:pSer/pThr/pTyr-binding forkhead associated (FHA) protein|nr:Glycogen accumulation regulator GarA [Planctomyces sp. SH-PL14]
MAFVTFQILDGLEAGRTYADLETPVTIGREEDCDIRLNDDRVSRLHARIQEDSGRIILTDVDSTNGTRINGHPIKIRVLQPGDQIVIGRCTLLYGSEEELDESAGRATVQRDDDDDSTDKRVNPLVTSPTVPPPELPSDLTTLQAAQLSDLLNYLQVHVLYTLDHGEELEATGSKSQQKMILAPAAWRCLQKVQLQLSRYLQAIGSPDR